MSQPTVSNYKDRDKYGRGVVYTKVGADVVCVRVTLPKMYRETHGNAYIVNDWAGPKDDHGHTTAHEVATLKEARAIEASIIAREVAARSE